MPAPVAVAGGMALALERPAPQPPSRLRRLAAALLIAFLLIGGLAAGLLKLSFEGRRALLADARHLHLEALASGRADLLASWLEGLAESGRPLAESDLIRRFASETSAHPPALPAPRWLTDQGPHMRRVIAEFTARHGLLGTALVGRNGRRLMASTDAPLLERASARRWASNPGRRFTPVRAVARSSGGTVLALDVILPVPAPGPGGTAGGETVAELVMTVPVAERLAHLLAPGTPAGARFRLVQQGSHGPVEIVPGEGGGGLRPLEPGVFVPPGEAHTYGGSLDRAGRAPRLLAVGAPVGDLPWTVLQPAGVEADARALQRYLATAAGLAAAAGLLLLLAFAALWWREGAWHRPHGAARAVHLLARLRAREQLFHSLADATGHMVSVTSPDGCCANVDAAFAAALGRPPADVLGRKAADFCLPAPAGAPTRSDGSLGQKVVPAGQAVGAERAGGTVELPALEYPLRDDGEVIGILAVLPRCRAELAAAPAPADSAQAAERLQRAIELTSPERAARAERMAGYAVAIAGRLGLPEPEAARLILATRLSPLGMAPRERPQPAAARGSLPHRAGCDEVLPGRPRAPTRPGPAIDHLQACGIERAVAEVIVGMHAPEYGLETNEPRAEPAQELAGILRTLDAFCARLAGGPEAARATPGRALDWLARHRAHLDMRVISALAELVAAERSQPAPADEPAGMAPGEVGARGAPGEWGRAGPEPAPRPAPASAPIRDGLAGASRAA